MREYNGHRSWNAWNVALWIGNDEGLYQRAVECLEESQHQLRRATRLFLSYIGGPQEKTPDGATYNRLSVKLALEGLMED